MSYFQKYSTKDSTHETKRYRGLGETTTQELHKAVLRRDVDAVRNLLAAEQSSRSQGSGTQLVVTNIYWNNETALHVACRQGDMAIINALIVAGSDVNGRVRETPLHIATSGGHIEAVRALLYREANINARNMSQATPLFIAAQKGFHQIARLLIDRGANINLMAKFSGREQSPLHIACEEGHVDIVKLLIKSGAKVNVRDDVDETALHYAAYNDHIGLMEPLVRAGAQLDPFNRMEMTPLHKASVMGNTETARKLIQLGHPVNSGAGGYEGTPLHVAVRLFRDDTVQMLVDMGADLEAKDSTDRSPLFAALCASDPHLPESHTKALESIIHTLVVGGSDIKKPPPIMGMRFAARNAHSMLDYTLQSNMFNAVRILLPGDCCPNLKLTDAIRHHLQSNDPDLLDLLHDSISQPRPLRQWCRSSIRKYFHGRWPLEKSVSWLPLPKPLQKYIMLCDIDLVED